MFEIAYRDENLRRDWNLRGFVVICLCLVDL